MARKLPWLSGTVKNSSSSSPSSLVRPVTAKPKRQKRARTPEDTVESLGVTGISSHVQGTKERSSRNESSSPPPSPPIPAFMKDGFDGDDGWVQVEDEFLATARLFTKHLHHAEYQRLKKQARAQNASAIHRISRPVDGRTKLSIESKMKIQGNLKRHDAKLSRREESDSEEDDPWINDPRLFHLMSTDKTKLAAVAGVKSKTRASEGYSQKAQVVGRATQTRGEFENAWNDLDQPARDLEYSSTGQSARHEAVPQKLTLTVQNIERNEIAGLASNGQEDTNTVPGRSPNKLNCNTLHPAVQSSSSDLSFDAFSAFPQRQASSYTERMAKRKADAAKREKQESRRELAQLEEIPTFLI